MPEVAPAQPGDPSRRPSTGQELIGPVVGGLVGLYLLGVTVGPGWTSALADLAPAAPTMVWVSVAYAVAAMLTAPVGAVLGRRSPNAVAATAAGLMLLGLVLDVLAPDGALLTAGQITSGLGAGALIAVAVVLTRLAARPWMYAISGLGALALVLGPVLGGGLATMFSWRLAFLVAVPPLLLALLASVINGIVSAAGRPVNR